MSDIYLLILFNIIIIFLSYKFKKNIVIIYPFVFILLITLYIQLIYKKNIEGFIDDDNERSKEVYSLWDRLNDDTYEEDNNTLIDKINKFLRILIDFEEKAEEEYDKIKCEGEFIVEKSDRDCGYNVYDEKVYKVTKPGFNCDHRAGYSEREFKDLCKLDDKCEKNRDCERGKCHRGKCKIDFKCSWDKLDNCDENGCDKLNEKLDFKKYKFTDGKCRINSCNEGQYYNCDKKGCSELGYKFRWDEENESCENREFDVMTCGQVKCPKGYSLNEKGKDYQCRKTLSREEVEERLDNPNFDDDEEVKGYIDECNSEHCCIRNYIGNEYFAPKKTDVGGCDTCITNDSCVKKCYHGENIIKDTVFENGVEKTYYYPYKEVLEDGDMFKSNMEKEYCNGLNCDKDKFIEQPIKTNKSCRNRVKLCSNSGDTSSCEAVAEGESLCNNYSNNFTKGCEDVFS